MRYYGFCIPALGVIVALFAVTNMSNGQSSSVINACIGTLSAGAVRIVSNPNQCAPGIEIPITWNIPGPQGPQVYCNHELQSVFASLISMSITVNIKLRGY